MLFPQSLLLLITNKRIRSLTIPFTLLKFMNGGNKNISRMFWNDFAFHSVSSEMTVMEFNNCSFVNVIMSVELAVELPNVGCISMFADAQVSENSEVIAP